MSAPAVLPPDTSDRRRLDALAAYGILDTVPESGFDDIADLAAMACAAPIALIGFVAEARQWFKAKVGFDPTQIELDRSVCVHALRQHEPLVIPDLTGDRRTRENPLVTGAPFLRFYAGVPLETADGERLGTLCVFDHVARPDGLTAAQASALRKLAGQVVSQMELRRTLRFRDAVLDERRTTLLRHEALVEAQEAVSRAKGDLDAGLDALVEGAMRAVPQAEGGVIEMREGDELVYRTVRGGLVPHKGLRLPLRGSLSGHCLLTGQSVSCPDVLLDDRVKRDVVTLLGMRSALYVPVMRAGTAVGVLKLQSGAVGAFAEEDLEIARLFAGTVAAGLAEAGEAEALRTVQGSRDRYKAVFNSAIDYAIIVMGLDGLVDDWNEGATRILGWSPAEMVERPADVFFTPEDRADGIADKEMQAALDTGRGVDERWHLRKDGSRFWANGEMMALRDESGTAIGFLKILRDRTEQRNAAARLQESEAFLRSVLDSSADCVQVLDLDSRIAFMNEGGRRIMAIEDSDGTAGRDWTESWDGAAKADAKAAVAAALAGGIGRFAGPARTARGTPRWFDVRVTPIENRDGAVGRLLAVSRDVTADRMTEEALVASETRYRDLYDGIDAGFCVIEVSGDEAERPVDYRFLQVNPAFERQSGLVDATGRWMRDLVPGHEDHWFETYRRIARGGAAERFERVASALGERWYEVYAYPFGVPGSHQVAILFNDITDRKRTEAALRASEASQRTILETVPVGILFAEAPGGRIVGGNARVEEILGHPVLVTPDLASDGAWQAFHADGRPVDPQEHPIARVISGGEPRAELQARHRRGDGAEIWIDIVAVPVRGAGGSVTGAVAAVSDIDARKRAEEQRDLLNHELSHRMKNLLAMVQAIASNTLRGATDVEAAKEVLAERLITLGKAHDLLLGGAAEHASIEPVIRGGVGLQDDGSGRVVYRGPAVEIGGRAALALALMVHELATNAAKYGALSAPGGRVDIAWDVRDGRDGAILAISWSEHGGPPVRPPSRKGFGSRLIERGLTGAVDGRIDLAYPTEGVRCVVEAPLRNFRDAP